MTVLSVQVPVLTTARLTLREPRLADFEAAAAFAASDRASFVGGPMARWEAWRGFAAGVGHWLLRGYGFWAVTETASGALVGRVGVINHDGWPEPELGWHVYAGFEGRGLAFEAALAVRDHASRELGLGPLISQIAPANTRSRRLAERLGAVIERETELLGKPCLIYRHPAHAEAAR